LSTPELPDEIRLEVKTSRLGTIPIGERDLVGVGPTGHVIALLNDRKLYGPRWVLVRATCRFSPPWDPGVSEPFPPGSLAA